MPVVTGGAAGPAGLGCETAVGAGSTFRMPPGTFSFNGDVSQLAGLLASTVPNLLRQRLTFPWLASR